MQLGIASALETLCGQASGAGQVEMLGKCIVFKILFNLVLESLLFNLALQSLLFNLAYKLY